MNAATTITAVPSALKQAGVHDDVFRSRTLYLQEIDGISIVRVHCLPGESPDSLPAKTGECGGADPGALCIRPGEWLLTSETFTADELLTLAKNRYTCDPLSINDNSDGLAVFRLTGSGAPWLLSKLSGLDFLAGAGTGEHCARTRMQHLAVLVHMRLSGDGCVSYDLYFDRSFARYFRDLLAASAPHADDLAELS